MRTSSKPMRTRAPVSVLTAARFSTPAGAWANGSREAGCGGIRTVGGVSEARFKTGAAEKVV